MQQRLCTKSEMAPEFGFIAVVLSQPDVRSYSYTNSTTAQRLFLRTLLLIILSKSFSGFPLDFLQLISHISIFSNRWMIIRLKR